MSITKWYEATCDYCGVASHYQGTLNSVKSQMRDDRWIITQTGVACSTDCRDELDEQHRLRHHY